MGAYDELRTGALPELFGFDGGFVLGYVGQEIRKLNRCKNQRSNDKLPSMAHRTFASLFNLSVCRDDERKLLYFFFLSLSLPSPFGGLTFK